VAESDALNELDSIDALLEEAEQAASDAEPDTEIDVTAQDPLTADETVNPDSPSVPEEAIAESTTSDISESIEDSSSKEPTVTEPIQAAAPETMPPTPPPKTALDESEKAIPEHHKKQGAKKRKSSNELTAAEMDTLKKLILGIGITLIILTLIGIGLATWAAVAASSKHLDEDTMSLLEEIKAGVEHVAVKSEHQDKTLTALEKKVDALSFQLEQLGSDIGKLEEILNQGTVTATLPSALAHGGVHTPVPTPTHGGGHATPIPVHGGGHTPAVGGHEKGQSAVMEHSAVAQQAHVPPAPVIAQLDPNVKKTLGSINSRLVRTHKKVERVYQRLVKLQSQYKAMLFNLKKVQKTLLEQQKQQKVAKQQKPEHRHNLYQYQATEAPFDPAHVDSYP
jgi:hypothetical protein